MALGANLRIGDAASFARVADALRKSGGLLDGEWGACKRLGVAHRTFMRWRQDIPKLETLVRTVRAEETAIKAAAARAAENGGSDEPGNIEVSDASGDDSGGGDASAAASAGA